MNNNDQYVYGIDALRFLAALFVAVFHLSYRNAEGVHFLPFGWIGVQLFFVISGVVIANSASRAVAADFLIGRFLRLYPAAWIAALINGAILLALPRSVYQEMGINVIPQLGAFLRSLVLFADYFLASSYWTLPIELAFYLLVAVSLLRGGAASLRNIARLLVAISLPYTIALFLHDAGFIDQPWLDFGYGLKNALLLRHGPYFALGMYIWLRKQKQPLGRSDRLAIMAALVLAGLEILARASETVGLYATGPDGRLTLPFLAIGGLASFLLLLCAVYVAVLHKERLIPPLRLRGWLRGAGLITYPFYLLHEVVGGAMLHLLSPLRLAFPLALCIALAGVGVAALAISGWGEAVLRRYLKALISAIRLKLGAGRAARI